MAIQNFADAFYHELRDLLGAERLVHKSLLKMIEAASHPDLIEALKRHRDETTGQIERLELAFAETKKVARAKECKAMVGIIDECSELLEEKAPEEVKDAMIIAACQKIEHYEITTYGTLCTWAELLGYKAALSFLKQSIAQEEKADRDLSKLALEINRSAKALSH